MILRGDTAQGAFDSAVSEAAQDFVKCVNKEGLYDDIVAGLRDSPTREQVTKALAALAEYRSCFNMLRMSIDFSAPHAKNMDRVLHLGRQSTYEVLGEAKFQVSKHDPDVGSMVGSEKARYVTDGVAVNVYKSEDDGKLYVRFPDEFTEDRFRSV